MNSKFRRTACLCLSGIMGVSLAAGQALAFAKGNGNLSDNQSIDNVSFENVSGKMDLTSVAMKNFSPQVLENAGLSSTKLSKNSDYTVIVQLSGESVLEAAGEGGVPEYLTTYSGRRTLKGIVAEQERLLMELSTRGIGYKLVDSYTTVANALALRVNFSNLERINKINGVESIVLSSSYAYPKTAEAAATKSANVAFNPSSIYGTGIYDSGFITDAEGDYGIDGSGTAVAILDTGLDYTHEAFTSYMPETVRYSKQDIERLMSDKSFSSETLSGAQGVRLTADDVYVNAKVPFAYDYADRDADVYPSYSNHGTHVAGIVAGQADSYYDDEGKIVYEADGKTPVPFRGVAPNAQLVICKVFTDNFDSENLGGAITEDILAALDDCLKLGVDVINMSLGSQSGFSSMAIKNDELGLNDTEGIWMKNVYSSIRDAGISLICAASNEYSAGFGSAFGTNLATSPDSGTVGDPSTYSGAMSVASINGQYAPYMTVTDKNGEIQPVFYLESSDENSVPYEFLSDMNVTSAAQTFKYVIIPGKGEAADYTSAIQGALKDKSEGKVIAVVTRGKTTFQEKVLTAMSMGADAVIMRNNVAGTVRMSLGDIDDPVPAVSVTMEAGAILEAGAVSNVGHITLNPSNLAGPFMNDYSSWGVTSDLKLKPDITAHGGEITSTVPGGYGEQSGTSMASPNFAGFVALLRSYLKGKEEFKDYSNVDITKLINNITMSSSTIVYDQSILPYSPRKQGSGLATLGNAFTTNAYLYTKEGADFGAEEGRPKVELGEDKAKKGEYDITFYVNNFGASPLSFGLKSIFMTESIAADGLSVAEKAHLFGDEAASWTVNGQSYAEGDTVTVPAKTTDFKVSVRLKLSAAEKRYLDDSFKNGMFIEGYIVLESKTDGQCSLSVPYLGFFGDWKAAPMLDYDVYEIAKFKQDTSMKDEERPKEQVWATQAFAKYYNGQFTVPMGSYMYVQDEYADQVYANADYASISCFDEYFGINNTQNYCTAMQIKALYAGLLRNAEVVQYKLYDDITGELLYTDYEYRVSKAISNGGSPIPANVELDLDPLEHGLVSNGKYRLDFSFYFYAEDVGKDVLNEDNTFSMTFYADYEAPVLENARVRYYDYKDGNKDKQRVYLDLDIYDNHYPQAVVLCYADIVDSSRAELMLATEYVTPVYNPVKNGTTTVSIEITDFYEEYKDSLYIQIDDYALNHSTYLLRLSSVSSSAPDKVELAEGKEITIGVNESYKLGVSNLGSSSLASLNWESSNDTYVKVKNGEIFGVRATNRPVTINVDNGKGARTSISVTVVEKNITLPLPSISFGLIETAGQGLTNAVGSVKVYAGKTFNLTVEADPWYYNVNSLKLKWRSSDVSLAVVDQQGTVTTLGEEGSVTITAVILNANGSETLYAATVMLYIQDPFKVANASLTDYQGPGGRVVIPDDKMIMSIGEEAFKDDLSIETVIIPKTVTQIGARAFQGCKNLKRVYFISEDAQEIADAKLALILEDAFEGCSSLELVDFTNAKVVSLAARAFKNCGSLKEVKKMSALGTLNSNAFEGCTSLKSVDLTGTHSSGSSVFKGCTSLEEVTTAYFTSIGPAMFEGCTKLASIDINTRNIAASAFSGCEMLEEVTFGGAITDRSLSFTIGARAFAGCIVLSEVSFNGHRVSSIGDQAFMNCLSLKTLALPDGEIVFGDRVFEGTGISISIGGGAVQDEFGAFYSGTKLLLAPKVITADFAVRAGTTAIADYAFSSSRLDSGVTSLAIPDSVTKIGEGAFAYLNAVNITLPAGITEIPDYAFYACTSLAAVAIPANVVRIGANAFHGCEGLASVDFNDKLTTIGESAFIYCDSLTQLIFPEALSALGSYAFANCASLTSVEIPAVKNMGEYVFTECPELSRVEFGDATEDIGIYTFFPGVEIKDNTVSVFKSSLSVVTLPKDLKTIGEGVFSYCSELKEINLRSVVSVGELAFAGCNALTVRGLGKLVSIGAYAFRDCYSIASLELDSAERIGDYAFAISSGTTAYGTLTLPKAVSIGNYAFYGSKINSVELPASLESIGYAAFAGCSSLRLIRVADGNERLYSADGVLFRKIDSKQSELIAYPAAKSLAEYTIPEGTVSVGAYAFAQLGGSLKKVTIPYSVKRIGVGAFVSAKVETYEFLGVNAPVLLTESYDNSDYTFINNLMTAFTLYYSNFENPFLEYSNIVTETKKSQLKVSYPVNGVGYDNYIFSNYFGTRNVGPEVLEDASRSFKDQMDEIINSCGNDPVKEIKSWLDRPVNTDNINLVTEFSEDVKEAHRVYNTILSESQRRLIDEGKEEGYYFGLLTSIEAELKPVKEKFGIAVNAISLKVSADSEHRSSYKFGERFDMTGLKLILTYDDYSTAEITGSAITLLPAYDRELSDLDVFVSVSANGLTVQVGIEVEAENVVDPPDPDKPEPDTGCGGCSSEVGGGNAMLAVFALLAVAAVTVTVKLVNRRKSK